MSVADTRFSGFELTLVAGALGAEVRGLDTSRPLAPETVRDLREAFTRHLVLFFRDQRLTPEQQTSFARNFGELEPVRGFTPLEGHPEILPLVKEPEATKNHGGGWHTDRCATARPPSASLLYAVEVPPHGGDTLFANQYLAYETLSPGVRAVLDSLRAVHVVELAEDARYEIIRKHGKLAVLVFESLSAVHPAVRVHPVSGRRALYVSAFVDRFVDWTREESEGLLAYLCEHAVRPELTCRFRWTAGAMALWDNRCVMHNAINDYNGFRRYVRRITIADGAPT